MNFQGEALHFLASLWTHLIALENTDCVLSSSPGACFPNPLLISFVFLPIHPTICYQTPLSPVWFQDLAVSLYSPLSRFSQTCFHNYEGSFEYDCWLTGRSAFRRGTCSEQCNTRDPQDFPIWESVFFFFKLDKGSELELGLSVRCWYYLAGRQ